MLSMTQRQITQLIVFAGMAGVVVVVVGVVALLVG